MTTYQVAATWWEFGWELHVDGLGVTQSRTLTNAEHVVRDFIACDLDLDDGNSFDITITRELPPQTRRFHRYLPHCAGNRMTTGLRGMSAPASAHVARSSYSTGRVVLNR